MKIKDKLTLLFAVITAAILFLFAFIIYYSASKDRNQEFNALLKKEAITKANLFFNANVPKNTLQEIYLNNRKILNEVEVAIYDSSFHLLYHDAADIDFVKETPEMIKEIVDDGEISFYQDKWQVVGLRYEFGHQNYIVIAAAYDQYGYNKLNSLFKTIVIVFIISILFIFLAGRFFSKNAFQPVKEMTEKAANISATHLDLRLKSNGNKDELSLLANTFNEMLERIENSFESQKHFVSNIAHEIRTPLAAIITELELTSNKPRNVEEYQLAIQNALNDAQKLARLSGSLLDFAKASYDPSEISFKPVRIDEILLDARQQVQKSDNEYKINIHFETLFEDDSQITINGNEYLLKVAFANLFENGCKFSADKSCTVFISFCPQTTEKNAFIQLKFEDKGIGIDEKDLSQIFTPFYRGTNKNFVDGNGIGLSLTHKIIDLHKGIIKVKSTPNVGTCFELELPQ